jgi:hypothetical protein
MRSTFGQMQEYEVDTAALRGLDGWTNATVAGIRDAVLQGRFVYMGMPEDPELDRGKQLFTGISSAAGKAVRMGRVFDLGHLPNKTIMSESKRAGELYGHGHIGHPFRDTYILVHTWEQGTAVYVISPDHEKPAGGQFIVAELACMRGPGATGDMLVLADAAKVGCDMSTGRCIMVGDFIPAPMRMMDNGVSAQGETQEALMCNLADPVLAAILLLATDGIAVERIEPSAKLAKARAKSGKPPIPPYWKAKTENYVTALSARGARRPEGTPAGHHSSPVPHLRKGHIRHKHAMHGGGTVFVRDALVMLKDGEEVPGTLLRSFYAMQNKEA